MDCAHAGCRSLAATFFAPSTVFRLPRFLALPLVVATLCLPTATRAQLQPLPSANGERAARIASVLEASATEWLGRVAAAGEAGLSRHRERFELLRRSDRCWLVRFGLRSDEPRTALGATMLVELAWLDPWELERVAIVAAPRLLDPDSGLYPGDLRRHLPAKHVQAVLSERPPLPRNDFNFLSVLHRSLRPTHIPALCRYVVGPDHLLRTDALETLHTVALHSGARRINVGAAILAWPGVDPNDPELDPTEQLDPRPARAFRLGAARPGHYPPMLAGVLRRACLEDSQLREMRRWGDWARRWAYEERPGPGDEPLLLELLGAQRGLTQQIGARGAVDRVDAMEPMVAAAWAEQVGEALQRSGSEASGRGDDVAQALSLLLRARAGHEGAVRELQDTAPVAGSARLAARLEFDATGVCAEVITLATTADETGAEAVAALDRARELGELAPFRHPADLGEQLLAALRGAWQRGERIGGRALAALFEDFPVTRRPDVAKALLEQLDLRAASREVLAVLALWQPEALRHRLQALAEAAVRAGDEPARLRARAAQLLVGDPAQFEALVAFVDGGPSSERACEERGLAADLVGRSAKTEAELQLLRQRVPERFEAAAARRFGGALDALAAVAHSEGWSARLVFGWTADLREAADHGELQPRWAELRAAVQSDGARAGLAHWLVARPRDAGLCSRLGELLELPEVRAHLERFRDERWRGAHAEAVCELAIGGDRAAQAELRHAFDLGIYDWLDEAPTAARPWFAASTDALLAAMSDNCCRAVAAGVGIEPVLGIDGSDFGAGGVRSRVALARAWNERFGGLLAPSRIHGRPVVTVHE